MTEEQETAKYAIQVTNELFHNVNVEAWKNIIESYEHSHSGLKVFLYFENKPIDNIHELNEWGKIRFGNIIYFSVRGPSFKGISKLKEYLFEGAGKRASRFRKQDVNLHLNLHW